MDLKPGDVFVVTWADQWYAIYLVVATLATSWRCVMLNVGHGPGYQVTRL